MRIVVKVGTSTLAHATGRLNIQRMERLCKVLSDLKNRETAKADDARRRWYANADAISAFLAGINACWNEEKWREFFDGKEATLRLQGDYAADIRMFDRIETEALRMADYMFCGLAMRCR